MPSVPDAAEDSLMANADSSYDIVVLGGGSGGYACALRAAELGRSVALVERAELGGTCLHRGCIPTKALLHVAEVADAARDGAKFGVRSSVEGIDLPAVHAYKDGVVGRLHKGLQGLIKGHHVEYVEGAGRLSSPHERAGRRADADRPARRARDRVRTRRRCQGWTSAGGS